MSFDNHENLPLMEKIDEETPFVDYSSTGTASSSFSSATLSENPSQSFDGSIEKGDDVENLKKGTVKEFDDIKRIGYDFKKIKYTSIMDLKQFIHFKIAISFVIWFISYMIMGIFGGSVAYYHFPRVWPKSYEPVPLPDFGYDIIPYYCPLYHHDSLNLQSTVLLFFYILILAGAIYKRNGKGRLIVQQLLHLNAIIFLIRTCTVGITGLPQPNPRCQPIQSKTVTYFEAVQFVMLRGFPPHACGDLIFSGHVACVLLCMVMFHKYNYFHGLRAYVITTLLGLLSILSVISCRSHYTVDVILAFYFVYFVQDWYFIRSNSINKCHFSPKCIPLSVKFIAWLEDRRIVIDDDDKNDSTKNSSCKNTGLCVNK